MLQDTKFETIKCVNALLRKGKGIGEVNYFFLSFSLSSSDGANTLIFSPLVIPEKYPYLFFDKLS